METKGDLVVDIMGCLVAKHPDTAVFQIYSPGCQKYDSDSTKLSHCQRKDGQNYVNKTRPLRLAVGLNAQFSLAGNWQLPSGNMQLCMTVIKACWRKQESAQYRFP